MITDETLALWCLKQSQTCPLELDSSKCTHKKEAPKEPWTLDLIVSIKPSLDEPGSVLPNQKLPQFIPFFRPRPHPPKPGTAMFFFRRQWEGFVESMNHSLEQRFPCLSQVHPGSIKHALLENHPLISRIFPWKSSLNLQIFHWMPDTPACHV